MNVNLLKRFSCGCVLSLKDFTQPQNQEPMKNTLKKLLIGSIAIVILTGTKFGLKPAERGVSLTHTRK